MTKANDRELLRRLQAGERGADGRHPSPESRRLSSLWQALEPPAAESAPPGFSARVMARVREEARRGSSPVHRSPLPSRLAAATALAGGLVAGAGLGGWIAAPALRVAVGTPADAPGGTVDSGEAEVAAAVVAATATATGSTNAPLEEALDQALIADPDLAESYLAALAALEEAS